MTDAELDRLIRSRARKRVLYRKLGTLVLRFVPLVSLYFIISVCIVRLWYYSARGVVHPTNIGKIAPTDSVFLALFVVVLLLWLAYLLAASCAQGFCRLHRLLIAYDVLAYVCIHVGRLVGFGTALPAIMTVFAALGLYLAARTHIKLHRHYGSK